MSDNGPAYPLFFFYLKIVTTLSVFISLFFIIKIYRNVDGDKCSSYLYPRYYCENSLVAYTSIGNYGRDDDWYYAGFAFGCLICFVIIFIILRAYAYRYRNKLSPHHVKISDYTVQVRGLGVDVTEQDLIEHYTKKGLQVVDAVLVYAPS